MLQKSHHFTLINSSAAQYGNEIEYALRSLGFYIDAIDYSPDLNPRLKNSIFIIDGDEEEHVYCLLNKARHIPKACLAIFVHSSKASFSKVFNYFEDFVAWPCELHEITLRLDRIINRNKTSVKNSNVQRTMIGSSPDFNMLLDKITRISTCDAPILIEGETGTGKELAARAIHYQGLRKDKPFIPVNCGALPDTLLENELFGHEKGAYTDARTSHGGLVAQADGGTLFLDEIDALSTKAQVTLLRFLQEMEYRPLGGGQIKRADIRVIAASNKSIEDLVRQAQFRDDLYFRLNIIPLRIPSLRERRDDIPELTCHFMEKFRNKYGETNKRLSAESFDFMLSYSWPGNVRELESMIHRNFLLSVGDEIVITDINNNTGENMLSSFENVIDIDLDFNLAKHSVINEFEKLYLHKLMASCQGNVTQAARQAGKERRALGKLLKKHGISKQIYY